MPVKRLPRTEAAELIRHCLTMGKVIPGKHFREELANEGLDILDAHHILKTGKILQEPEPDIRSGDWKYRIEGIAVDGGALAIVFCFKDADTAFLITAFGIRK